MAKPKTGSVVMMFVASIAISLAVLYGLSKTTFGQKVFFGVKGSVPVS